MRLKKHTNTLVVTNRENAMTVFHPNNEKVKANIALVGEINVTKTGGLRNRIPKCMAYMRVRRVIFLLFIFL